MKVGKKIVPKSQHSGRPWALATFGAAMADADARRGCNLEDIAPRGMRAFRRVRHDIPLAVFLWQRRFCDVHALSALVTRLCIDATIGRQRPATLTFFHVAESRR